MKPLSIYLGYDPREHDAYMVAKHSIERRASVPVLITPLHLDLVAHIIPPPIKRGQQMWDIESDAPQSTEFARSRFCITHLQRSGWALFVDSDILCLADIAELFALADDRYAVMCVKHDQGSGPDTKMDGQAQTYYARKNWSSVMLINGNHEGHYRLTKTRLNMWPGRDLHAFKWLEDGEIGALPTEWNHLVGISPETGQAKILHYTLGTPDIVDATGGVADLWRAEQRFVVF